jgi:hypothetical protein
MKAITFLLLFCEFIFVANFTAHAQEDSNNKNELCEKYTYFDANVGIAQPDGGYGIQVKMFDYLGTKRHGSRIPRGVHFIGADASAFNNQVIDGGYANFLQLNVALDLPIVDFDKNSNPVLEDGIYAAFRFEGGVSANAGFEVNTTNPKTLEKNSFYQDGATLNISTGIVIADKFGKNNSSSLESEFKYSFYPNVNIQSVDFDMQLLLQKFAAEIVHNLTQDTSGTKTQFNQTSFAFLIRIGEAKNYQLGPFASFVAGSANSTAWQKGQCYGVKLKMFPE